MIPIEMRIGFALLLVAAFSGMINRAAFTIWQRQWLNKALIISIVLLFAGIGLIMYHIIKAMIFNTEL